MAGHSKWANIKHRKEGVDRKRGLIFHKIAKEITVAVKLGGADISANPRLKLAITKAKANNMPGTNIDKAIKKGSGDLGGAAYEEHVYESYSDAGVGILIDALTDNKNRTTPEIKNILSKNGASLATSNSVSRLFERMTCIDIEKNKEDATNISQCLEKCIEADVKDILEMEDIYRILALSSEYENLSQLIENEGVSVLSSNIRFMVPPDLQVEVKDEKKRDTIEKLIEILENHDDVQAVYSTMQE